MSLRLEITTKAQAQILEIADYGDRHWGQSRSDEYVNGLLDALEMLARFPNAGREFHWDRAFLRGKQVWRFSHESHQIFYSLTPEAVQIIAIGGKWQLPENVMG